MHAYLRILKFHIKQKKELNDAWKEIMEDAKKVVEDYAKDPSQISGSVIRIHEDSPFMSDSKALEGDKWKYALIPKNNKNVDKNT